MLNKNLIVTGGLGFIGKNYLNHVKDNYENIIVIDKGSKFSDYKYYENMKQENIKLYEININNISSIYSELPKSFDLINFAAESHVDRSFRNSINFSKSNYLDSHLILDFLKNSDLQYRFMHISTDEVYGSSEKEPANELHPISPTNPYSTSKAAADLLMQTYIRCYNMPILVIRPNNIFGPYQNAEKLIPGVINCINNETKFGIHGTGHVKRSFLHVEDFINAVNILFNQDWNLLEHKDFNITSKNEYSVIEIITKIGKLMKLELHEFTKFIEDRPFNDTRYLTCCDRLKKLGWKEEVDFDEALEDLVKNKKSFKILSKDTSVINF